MNYTSNYQLSQWDKSDRILMEDFNADNAKVDTALAELSGRSCLIPIKEVVVTTPTVIFPLSLEGIDWDQWQAVVFDFDMTSDKTNLVAQVSPTGTLNDLVGTFYIGNIATPVEQRDGPSRMILFSNRCGRTPVHSLMMCRNTTTFYSIATHLNAMETLYITNGSQGDFTAGSVIRIYGLR